MEPLKIGLVGLGSRGYMLLKETLPDFATFSILTTEKYIENTAFGLYFFTSML